METASVSERSPLKVSPVGIAAVLLGLALVSWIVTVWMAAIAGVIFAEKVLPWGERLTRVIGVAFVALGIWIMLAPDSVPGLTDPGSDIGPSMQMEP